MTALRSIHEAIETQWGVIARWQLLRCGLTRAVIRQWIATGRLHEIYPRTYAVGHRSLCIEGRLVAALLYGGEGAALSHGTAAWWWGLTDREPSVIDISVTRRRSPQPGLRVHHPRRIDATRHRRFLVTTVARTLLDEAASSSVNHVRYLLAEADYRRVLDWDQVETALGQGQPGSATLRAATNKHRPQLAFTRSELERAFLHLCERGKLPIPEVNVKVEGHTVDALWRAQRVIVEVDGKPGHSSAAQMERDRDRDLRLRAAGYVVLRYSWKQVQSQPDLVIRDIEAALAARR